ncbi:hypothetical protein COEREDRAFT_11606 [Coemansia reversa NRRL 1564]|uniref:Uncharacterized protein n=1 Tax=Coemansia reversa (strain ATCC 12441 / NRRL 1564) TaxID=763665 RepID=A0A2G5B2N3_COERN|nr:hypothetical protein COEREDRAFT_11606 [Coemansia reversa NRRL 1564]|eukprot:PIA13254.1 hypothetical protein COEREDRAFT_11606 [Coemansia reversa NRRL 1564]
MHIGFALFTVVIVSTTATSTNIDTPMAEVKRQMPGNMPEFDGMNGNDRSPFAAFWNQGLVPGQGFPQVGMSAYGYGLPELGLNGVLGSDALILAGAGQGKINNHDLEKLDNHLYNYDQFKDNESRGSKPDPTYPGCFKSEDCDTNGNAVGHVDNGNNGRPDSTYHHYYHDSAAARIFSNNGGYYFAQLVTIISIAATLCT